MEFDIAHHGFDSGDIFFDGADPHRIVELVDGLLEAQFEKLIFQLKELSIQLRGRDYQTSVAWNIGKEGHYAS